MKVLIVGSGGREHAIAWKISQSPRLSQLYISPGNAGTAQLGENVPIPSSESNFPALVNFALEKRIDIVIVGPEIPLAAGLADELHSAGIRVFGPSRAAAQIEASKAFAKDFMTQHQIPTARYALFDDFDQAREHLDSVDYPIVLKASGLAAGKGVILPETRLQALDSLRGMMLEGDFGEAGDRVVIEERLEGEEVSLLAFSDGSSVSWMPPAQDHKRLLDGDQGPNTGGMGAFAPAPICPPDLARALSASILQPVIDGLREAGHPFVGVLYAGLILTPQGPRVLEFNCRFGDPETQVILPLLETDLLEIVEACVEGRLDQVKIRWKQAAAACVVLASENYPGKSPQGRVIYGLERSLEDSIVFHAGTKPAGEQVITAAGRVLGVTGWGDNIEAALKRAYQAVAQISFEGLQYRRDIGHKALAASSSSDSPAYSASGVNINAGGRAVELLREAVQATHGPQVLAGVGAFGGLFDAGVLKQMRQPVLAASTDGVGTKVKLAAQVGHYESIGHDIVNHCINDILVQGARPLFFMDYFASSRLQPEIVAEVVKGMVSACQSAGCALLGGETAEMPGVYAPGEFDVAGTIVGVAERDCLLPRPDLSPGDILLGLRSSGPHTNGYSLIRKVFDGVPLERVFPELGLPLAEALLAPHRSYLPMLSESGVLPSQIKALVHITGGGFCENIPRILPEHLGANLHLGSWPVPPLFNLIQERGRVATREMYRVFNMGIGMVIVVDPLHVETLQQALPEEVFRIGELVSGDRTVALV